MTPFAHRLRAERIRAGLTQRELGKRAQMPNTSISHFERGAKQPTVESLYRLAKVLGVSGDYLIGHNDCPAGQVLSEVVAQQRALLEIASYCKNSGSRSEDVATWAAHRAERALGFPIA